MRGAAGGAVRLPVAVQADRSTNIRNRTVANHEETAREAPFWHVLGAITMVLMVKFYLVLGNMPSMWIWGDEMLYYTTSYDITHLGQTGVPHPNLFHYPPLTSVVIAPIHLFELSPAASYQLALILLNLVHAAGVIAAYLLVHEVFGLKSRLLVLLLLVGPAAYGGFALMSETPFIALYLWLLYFYVRQWKTGDARYAAAVGVLMGLMILTRKNGIGLIASVLAVMLVELFPRNGTKRLADRLRLPALTLLIALGIGVTWKLILAYGLEIHYGYYGPLGYIKHGLLPALSGVESAVLLTRKFLANLSYVSLSTYGLGVPLVGWFCLPRRAEAGELAQQRKLLRALMLHVLVFLLFAAFVAAVHMFINSDRSPNTRYLMYGRYVEYFSALLTALGFGIVAGGLRGSRRSDRCGLLLMTLAIAIAVSAVIPSAFFANQSGAASNMGIGWLISLSEGSRLASLMIGPVAATLLILLLSSPWFSTKRLVRSVVYVTVLALALFNLAFCGELVVTKSRTFHEEFMGYSAFVSGNPELFEEGLFVDVKSYTRRGGRRDGLATQKLIVEHLDKVVVGPRAEKRLGEIPVMSRLTSEKVEILFQAEGFANKIYGTRTLQDAPPRSDSSAPPAPGASHPDAPRAAAPAS